MSDRVLIISPDSGLRARLTALSDSQGWRNMEASNLRDGLASLRSFAPQFVMVEGPDATPESIRMLAETSPSSAVWVLHDPESAPSPEQLLEAGCQDVLDLPVSPSSLRLAHARSVRNLSVQRSADWMRRELEACHRASLTGQSRSIVRVRDQVQRIASTPRTTVLVTGESGSGKQRVARAIHRASARASGPFVFVPCGLPEPGRLETLLYGPPSNSHGDAAECALASAEGGTLYLAQIEHVGPEVQRRILQLLQDRTWSLGDEQEDRVGDLRVIASTSVDLTRLVEEGRFREDLLYRLNVLSVEVPPLRERREDLPDLTQEALNQLGVSLGRPGLCLAPDAVDALNEHGWAGNLGELENALERGAIAASGNVITRSDLGLIPPPGGPIAPAGDTIGLESFQLRRMEEVVIRRALESAQGNRSETARLLGVNRTTLYNKLRAYEIDG